MVSEINKRKLFIDFDSTTTDTILRIIEMYNEDYKDHRKFKTAIPYLVETWNFEDQCPLAGKDKIDSYFNQERFFKELKFIENAEEIINKLSKTFDIYIVSMGNTQNLYFKGIWLQEHLKCIKGYLPVDFKDYKDKASINMASGILIDDCSQNLESSNADLKICYGDLYEWNKSWNGKRCWNWTEVYDFLIN